jgi:hypothetical protein
MAKRKAASKKAAAPKNPKAVTALPQDVVLVYVPDAIYNLGGNMQQMIGAMNSLWAKSFGVKHVWVDNNSAWPNL